jgi:probable HAF family extracellular repeat protein
MKIKIFFICLFVLFISADFSGAQDQYKVVDIGYLLSQADMSSAKAINNRGQVAGYSFGQHTGGGYINHAIFWDPVDGMIDLGTLGGSFSGADGINDSGQVVGAADSGDSDWHAFIWDRDNGMQDLGTLGGWYSSALAINNRGQVVGRSATDASTRFFHATYWDEQTGLADLYLGGDHEYAYGINDSGQIVGMSSFAFLYDSVTYEIIDIGNLGSWYSVATNISNSGYVSGFSRLITPGPYHAFIWGEANGIEDIGTLGGDYSLANAVNDSGLVVGWSYIEKNCIRCEKRAFVWSKENGMQDLNILINDPSWVLEEARDINDKGQIVGNGKYNGKMPVVPDLAMLPNNARA